MESLKGYVDHIIYQNSDNGYTVLILLADDEEEITCVGNFKGVDTGENLLVKGTYVEHPVYGRQMKAEFYEVTPPDDARSMMRYLSSGAIKGIGEALAKRIVERFGDNTFQIMEQEPERLAEVKGISERIAREIAEQVIDKREMRDAFLFLQQYGISNTLAIKIYNTYHLHLYGIMKENPYKLAEDIDGIGFKLADEIAGKIGIFKDSDYRIRSGILYILMQAGYDGHVYLPAEILIKKTAELLLLDGEYIYPQLMNMAMDKKIIIKKKGEKQNIYISLQYYAELNCAKMLHELNVSMQEENLAVEEEKVRKKIRNLEKEQKIELDELQVAAIVESIKHGLVIISGGPGTGKTTIINTMIRIFVEEEMDILLAAPTGRAAKRMTEATGYEAKTIHRLLELNGAVAENDDRNVRFEKNEENPLEADVIIIDEMSMIDLQLFQALLKAICIGTRLILVGDVDQLPSVGPGQILRDMIESQCFSTVILEKIFRQTSESDIVVNAHKINNGEEILLDNKSKDFFFLERNDANVIYKHMIQLIQEKLPGYVDASPYEIQILTPMRKGTLGVEMLNGILQKYLNPPSDLKREYAVGERLFREGDKVMQIKNDYQIEWEVVSQFGIPIDKGMGVFNGDMGIVVEINEAAAYLMVEFEEHKRVTYLYTQLDEIELAYAITIHKSQGSEYPAVILPLLSGPSMLYNRNLLYTAVTRARKCVTILGSADTVKAMIRNERQNQRYTGFKDRIVELKGEVWI